MMLMFCAYFLQNHHVFFQLFPAHCDFDSRIPYHDISGTSPRGLARIVRVFRLKVMKDSDKI